MGGAGDVVAQLRATLLELRAMHRATGPAESRYCTYDRHDFPCDTRVIIDAALEPPS